MECFLRKVGFTGHFFFPTEKVMAPHSSTLAWKIPWRSLVGCSPWGREESDTTERLYFHFSLSCIGEGNGDPLQCSCLENPRVSGAWLSAVHGVVQSRTQLKRQQQQQPGDRGGQRSLAYCSPWGHRVRHDLATEQQHVKE